MMILALETATNICSVAFEDNNGKLYEQRTDSPGSHSEKLFLFIKKLMEEHRFTVSDLSAVLVSEGPGSYTGLRIAASGVKGLLFGSDVPLYRVSTLASFAISAHRQSPDSSTIHAILDARRVHLYHQAFCLTDEKMQTIGKVDIIPIQSFEKMAQSGDVIIGTGIGRIDGVIREKIHCLGENFISARSLINLYHRKGTDKFVQKADPATFDPNYFTSGQERNAKREN